MAITEQLTVVNPRALTPQEWRCIDMSVAGATLAQMATELGYATTSGALQLQRRAFKAYSEAMGDDIGEWRTRLVAKSLRHLEALAPAAEQGDVQSIKVGNEVIKVLANMLGIMKPARVEVAGYFQVVEVTDAERVERVAKLLAGSSSSGVGPGVAGPDGSAVVDPAPQE